MKAEAYRYSPIQILRDELGRRLEKNPRYSLRAFAKSLGVTIGCLSELLNQKRPLTSKTAEKIFTKLDLSPAARNAILADLTKQNLKKEKSAKETPIVDSVRIEEEIFRAISDWYHLSILQIVRTDAYLKVTPQTQVKWISRQLKISEAEAKLAIERLCALGLLDNGRTGHLVRTQGNLTTSNKSTTSTALKKHQKQIREKALQSLDNDPIEVRCMTGMTMAIDPKKINEARKLIDSFQENLSQFLEKGKKEKVYQLEVSLFPLQVLEN